MSVISFDTETWLIAPGLFAPPLVCLQWQKSGPYQGGPSLIHHDAPGAKEIVVGWLQSDAILVGHNVAYDTCVLAAQYPDLLPAIFAKYDRGQVTDTKIREQLIMIARGQFRSWEDTEGELHPVKYDLAACIQRHFGRTLKKEGFRLFYRAFDALPDISLWTLWATNFQRAGRKGQWPAWLTDYQAAGLIKQSDIDGLLAARPEEAVEYALADATTTLELYEDQTRVGEAMHPDFFADEFRQARAAFALRLSSCWGVHTDPDAVDLLEVSLRERFENLKKDLQAEGIIRANGTANTKAARAVMVQACAEEGFKVMMTKGGKKSAPQVSLSAEACGRFDDWSLIGQYSEFLTVRKTISNDIKMLRMGCDTPIQPQYDIADTGRTRAAKPALQAINRGEGIRECFRPRPGTVFIQGDFEGLELHTLAEWCITTFGHSKLGEALNAGTDVHTLTAANMLGMSYDEAMRQKAQGSPEIKEYRQRAKAVNFGFPGGLGVKKLVRYAKAQYGVTMTENEAVAAKRVWVGIFPEMNHYFADGAIRTREGDATEAHLFTGRWRGGLRYSALLNGRFQGLGADASKEALWRVTRACYVEPASPLYGCRVVAFVHDEIIAECPDCPEKVDSAARELGRLMCEGANVYLRDVPVRVKPQAMSVWSKKAEPVIVDGKIVPWNPSMVPPTAPEPFFVAPPVRRQSPGIHVEILPEWREAARAFAENYPYNELWNERGHTTLETQKAQCYRGKIAECAAYAGLRDRPGFEGMRPPDFRIYTAGERDYSADLGTWGVKSQEWVYQAKEVAGRKGRGDPGYGKGVILVDVGDTHAILMYAIPWAAIIFGPMRNGSTNKKAIYPEQQLPEYRCI